MRDGGPIDQQIRELFHVLPTLFHVNRYVDVGDGGSLVTQGHLSSALLTPRLSRSDAPVFRGVCRLTGRMPARVAISTFRESLYQQ